MECIKGYIIEDAVGDRTLKRLPKRRLNLINGAISSYCSIHNSPKKLEHIRQAKKMASVLCDLKYYCLREKEEKKKRVMEAEENRRRKYEDNQVREN